MPMGPYIKASDRRSSEKDYIILHGCPNVIPTEKKNGTPLQTFHGNIRAMHEY